MTDLNLANSCPGNLQGTSATIFLALLNTLMNAKCTLKNSNEYPEDYGPKLKDGDEFDFIVVGGGSAGSVVANKLSEIKEWKVLVLEAGGLPSSSSNVPILLFSLEGTEEDWAYKTEPHEKSCLGLKNKQCRWPRGKALGGTSVINAMLYVKGNKNDYDHWAKLGNTGWDWDSIKGYFTELERVSPPESETTPLGTKGLLPLTKFSSKDPIKLAIQEGYEQLGIKYLKEQNPENPTGTVDVPLCIHNGQRANVGKKILGAYRNRTNLFVSLHSLVQKIIIKRGKAKGVEVKIGERILRLKAKKEVIVSAGSINSPQLLMLSGIGPRDHLTDIGINVVKDLSVGQFLEDHTIFAGFHISADLNSMEYPENPVQPVYDYFMYQRGALSTIGLTNFISFFNTKNDSIWPNVGFHYILYPPNDNVVFSDFIRDVGFTDDIIESLTKACRERPCLSLLPTLLNPKSFGKILLKSENPEDHPLIYSGYFTDEGDKDIEVFLDLIRFTERLIETQPMKNYNPQLIHLPLPDCEKFEYRSDNYWKCSLKHTTSTVYHPTGTCKMGPNEEDSVVDPRLRVHGIKFLRVVDASIMPKIVSGNTHAPSMMIGFKASEMIKEDWLNINREL